jgi:hypothetical protein
VINKIIFLSKIDELKYITDENNLLTEDLLVLRSFFTQEEQGNEMLLELVFK